MRVVVIQTKKEGEKENVSVTVLVSMQWEVLIYSVDVRIDIYF